MNATDRIIYAQTNGGTKIGTAREHLAALRAGRMSLTAWLKQTAASIGFFQFDDRPRGKVAAEINHGHWIVRCPACPGAEEADPLEPVFYCLSCGNADNGGHVMEVQFPAPEERSVVEVLLLLRPDLSNRNWQPDESAADLLKENHAQGVM